MTVLVPLFSCTQILAGSPFDLAIWQKEKLSAGKGDLSPIATGRVLIRSIDFLNGYRREQTWRTSHSPTSALA